MNPILIIALVGGGLALMAGLKQAGKSDKTGTGGETGTGGGAGTGGGTGAGKPNVKPGDKLPTGEYVPADIPEVSGGKWTEEDAKSAVAEVARIAGIDVARALEKTWRQESGGFKSGEYRATGGAGLHPFRARFPYRPDNSLLAQVWKERPELRPTGYYWGREGGTGKMRVYLAFPTPRAFAGTFALYILKVKQAKRCDADEAAATWYGRWGTPEWKQRLADLKQARARWV